MKYWYLKEGDILGPWTPEEIAKDNLFIGESLVCPQDKAKQAEFWKPAKDYAQDFGALLAADTEMEPPQEIALDNIEPDDAIFAESEDTPKEEPIKEQEREPVILETKPQEFIKQETVKTEEKNPFESDRPQIAPNIEDTISSHMIAPRLDADGDTLLEDIPAKAILGEENKEETSDVFQDKDFVSNTSLPSEDTLEDTPILNIFERGPEKQQTKELQDISDNIYDTYGADKPQKEEIKIKGIDRVDVPQQRETKNNKIYLLFIVMFILVAVALVLAFSGNHETDSDNGQPQAAAAQSSLFKTSKDLNKDLPADNEEVLDMPKTDTSAFLNTEPASSADRQTALMKVKKFILSNGKTLEEYLEKTYSTYQTAWIADVLSARNYYVHFNASKVRQEPIVYSFSIDLDKNEISGLNNLGIDLLIKGE